jgi:hypothetical protein
MAQIPKNLPASTATSVTSGRLQGGVRSVASSDSSPIQELSSQESVLFNDALLYQEEDEPNRRRRHSSARDPLIEYAGSTQTFAAVFEESNARGTGGNVQQVKSKGFAGLMVRAINVYEENVRVIQGTSEQRGTNLSMTL